MSTKSRSERERERLAYQREYSRERIDLLKRLGLCTRCGTCESRWREGLWECADCARKYADRSSARRAARHNDPDWPVCRFHGCNRPALCKGLCNSHYAQAWSRSRKNPDGTGTGTLTPLQKRTRNPPSTCTIEGCERPYKAKGLCMHHYCKQRNRKREQQRKRSIS